MRLLLRWLARLWVGKAAEPTSEWAECRCDWCQADPDDDPNT